MVNRTRALSMNFSGHKSDKEERRLKESLFELKEVLNTIKYDWPQVLKPEANPIEMAVALLDDTSVGMAHKMHEFERISDDTNRALRHVVSENHEIFNNSIGSYHLLLSTLQDSQEDSSQIKEMLESSTRDIHDRSDVLNELDQTAARYSEMIEILDAMESLNAIPDKVEQLIVDKKIHEVYDVISNGYKLAEQYNLWALSAMGTIQTYLEMQSNNLFDMIIDELQNEIYLKNVALVDNVQTQSRAFFSWDSLLQSSNPQLSSFKTLITSLKNLEQYVYNSANLDIFDIADCFTDAPRNFISKQLPKLHAHYTKHESEINYSILLDSNASTSSQSFHYMYLLLHTASRLNRLPQVIEILVGTNQQELHGLINRTTEECKLKNVQQLSKISKIQNYDNQTSLDTITGHAFNDSSVIILQDLFGSIFIKSLIVLQKHKIVSEIIDKIESGQRIPLKTGGSADQSTKSYNFHSIWNVMKKELQSLMVNYTYDNSQFKAVDEIVNSHDGTLHEVLLKKDIFKFEDVSYTNFANKAENMSSFLNDMFPGFAISDGDGNAENPAVEYSSPYIKNETFNGLVEVLVPKNIFNMRIILEFFLIFTAGSQNLFLSFADESKMKNPDKTAVQFFYNFMKSSFLYKLEECLDRCFVEYVGGVHSNGYVVGNDGHSAAGSSSLLFIGFKLKLATLDTIDMHGSIPNQIPNPNSPLVFQNALDFKRFFLNACYSLNASLAYRADISDLLLKFLKKFSNTYNNFYKELLSQGGNAHDITSTSVNGHSATHMSSNKPNMQLNKWMRTSALTEISGTILGQSSTSENLQALLDKEAEIMLFNNEGTTEVFNISKDDYLDDLAFDQVCQLLLTTSWILSWLPGMRKESNYTIYNDATDTVKLSTVDKLKHDWSFLENGRSNYALGDKSQNIFLALNSGKINEFDDIVNSFEVIRDKALLSLRYDLRARATYFLGLSFKENDWLPNTEPGDSDQFTGQFNKEVFSVDNKLSTVLNNLERDSVFLGLPDFINKLLIKGSELIRKVNRFGIKRVMLNITTLNQMLKSVMKQPELIDFARSSRYFDMFTYKKMSLVQELETNKMGFSQAEFSNLLRLMYSEKLADGGGTSFNVKRYQELARKVRDAFA